MCRGVNVAERTPICFRPPFTVTVHHLTHVESVAMAIWKEQTSSKSDSTTTPQSNIRLDDAPLVPTVTPVSSYRPTGATMKESVIAAELTIEGKIEGAGHIRMAGHFKGDVNVDGNLTIEPGAKVTGSVRAHKVVIGGELEGNIEAASHVQLLQTGVLPRDLRRAP